MTAFAAWSQFFTVTATGSGKLFCYQLAAMNPPHSVFLVICPLVNLIDNKEIEAQRLGIKAFAVNNANCEKDPYLVNDVANRYYCLVFSWTRMTS